MIRAERDSRPATRIFCRSSRNRGTGMASRYRSDDHDASDAMVSPKNRLITTISRKLAEKNNDTMAKFAAPDLARSTNELPLPLLFELPPPIENAISRITGSATMNPSDSWVRLRRSCRISSTRTGRVRAARNPSGTPEAVGGSGAPRFAIA